MSEKIYKDYTEEDLKQHFKDAHFKMIALDVLGRKKTITLVCEKGHETTDKISASLRRKICHRCTSLLYKDNLDKRLSANDFTILNYTPDITTNSIVQVQCGNGHIRKGKLSLYIHNSGCKACAGKVVTKEQVTERLLMRGYTLLGNYTYLHREYDIVHNECGYKFHLKSLLNIYNNRTGCPRCAGSVRLPDEEIIEILSSKSWRILDWYEKERHTKSKAILECTECGLTREGVVGNYLYKGVTCPDCTERNYDKWKDDTPTTLYYLRVRYKDFTCYKIGITANSILTRFYKDFSNKDIDIEMLSQLQCDTRLKARTLERHFLTTFSEYRYKGSPILLSGGNTELFTEDVLELDT